MVRRKSVDKFLCKLSDSCEYSLWAPVILSPSSQIGLCPYTEPVIKMSKEEIESFSSWNLFTKNTSCVEPHES